MLGLTPVSSAPLADIGATSAADVTLTSAQASNAFGAPTLDFELPNVKFNSVVSSNAFGAPAISTYTSTGQIIDTDDYVRTGESAKNYIADADDLPRTGEWTSYAITDADDYVRTGESVIQTINAYSDRPTPFVFTGEWPEVKPAGWDSAEVTNDVVADLRVRDLTVPTLGDSLTVTDDVVVGFRIQNVSPTAIDAFAGGWIRVIGFDQQYITFCNKNWDSLDMSWFEEAMNTGIRVTQTSTIRPAGIAPAHDEMPWPKVEYRTKTITVRSIQSGHGQMGMPTCQLS